MDTSALLSLLGPEGQALLKELPPYTESDALRLSTELRARGFDAELVSAALTQARLRSRAEAKFGERARGMFFTPEGLEQSTRAVLGERHAQRYAQAGARRVADLGCGIGADALALSAQGLPVLAVEADATTAAVAAANLRRYPRAAVRHGDALAVDLRAEGVDAVFADPARRTRGRRRVFDPSAYAPPLDAVLALREHVALGVKVAPGIPYSALPDDAHAQWVSVDGEVLEAGLWFGAVAPEGPGRSAVVLAGRAAHTLTEPGTAPHQPARLGSVRRLGSYLHEPDGAVIRAGLVARLADELGAGLLSQNIAYLTTDEAVSAPFTTGYRVLDQFPFGLKRLRSYLRARDVGPVTIKKRGTAVEPERLRSQLGLRGRRSATIVLTRLAEQHSVIVVEPI